MGAPTAKVETIVLVSPIKVLCLLFDLFTILSLLISVLSTFWIRLEDAARVGLWHQCSYSNQTVLQETRRVLVISGGKASIVNKPITKALVTKANEVVFECTILHKVWVHISAALLVVSLGCAIIGFVLLILGLRHKKGPERKKKYYRAVIFVLIIGFVSILLGLLLYPAMMIPELQKSNKDWYLGWSYGLGWAAAFFLAGANILILCDRNREEVLYTERLVISDENDNFEENQEAKIKPAAR